jgi:hypothetical protein
VTRLFSQSGPSRERINWSRELIGLSFTEALDHAEPRCSIEGILSVRIAVVRMPATQPSLIRF